MTTRTSVQTITFRHPFRMNGIDDVQPAGNYLVETNEEQLQTLLTPAYRRLSTQIHLAGTANSNELARIVDIDPTELAAALAHDAQAPEAASLPTDHAPIGDNRTKDSTGIFVLERWTRWLFATPAN